MTDELPSYSSLSDTPLFKVYLCGPLRILQREKSFTEQPPTYRNIPPSEWGERPGSTMNLLKVLLCNDRLATKTALADALWPEAGEREGRHSLNQAVRTLRILLHVEPGDLPGDNPIISLLLDLPTGDGYHLADQSLLWVDIDAFDDAMKQATRAERKQYFQESRDWWERAYSIVKAGTFLPTDLYSDWAAARRRNHELQVPRCVRRLAEYYLSEERVTEAEEILRAYWAAHPTEEDILLMLMHVLQLQGFEREALTCYEQSVKALDEDLGVRPSTSISDFAARLLEQQHQYERVSNSLFHFSRQNNTSSLFSQTATQDIMKTVRELEGVIDVKSQSSIQRRAVIAHLLGIPPVLFASDKNAVDTLADAMKFQEETLYSLYEDMLVMGWESFRRNKSPQIVTRIDEHVNKLTVLARYDSTGNTEHWQSLLCRFSQLSTRIAQHRMNEHQALSMAKQAIMLAIDLDDAEAIASTFYGRGRVHMEYSNTATDSRQKRKHFDLAKADIDAALGHVERVRIPLAGNIYLLAAEIYAQIAGSDMLLRTQSEKWQDKVAYFIDSKNIEDDGTFLKLNPTALHHERAKTLLRFGRIEEARRELDMAWKTLQPNLFTWHMNMYLTQASLFLAEHNIEESVQSSLKAHSLARTISSHKGEVEVEYLLEQLQLLDKSHSSVRNLAMIVEAIHEQ